MSSPLAATRRLLRLALVAIVGACETDMPTTPRAFQPEAFVATGVDAGVSAILTGFGILNDNNEQVYIEAIKHRDGSVTGFASGNLRFQNSGALKGPAVELVPPDGTVDFWCVNMAVANVPELQGFNVLVFIRDIGDGRTSLDEWATNGGFGLTCAAGPQPPFSPLVKGDLRGIVR